MGRADVQHKADGLTLGLNVLLLQEKTLIATRLTIERLEPGLDAPRSGLLFYVETPGIDMNGQSTLTRRYRFSAAHRLHTDRLSVEENKRIYGKCNNPNGHGHNYTLFVTVSSRDARSVETEPFITAVDEVVYETVVIRFDHRDLNQDQAFLDKTTTGENLVLLIWELLINRIQDGQLRKIGLIETRDNYFEYTGGTA